ncbi:Initiation-specific alpha-1,6-mannosyltransferase [Sphaceloma murrayae]|uniref:Initiation-specific alpha-1,6-mannosyltransferase n=1 Tax=Sphaceloma murrayae TaxID=2082308 RepID=A0A2K1QLA7_9PEZI|nr:Initiation-specific alpha-1,6-mannosyltransferase [Sphaceloma murrayae]
MKLEYMDYVAKPPAFAMPTQIRRILPALTVMVLFLVFLSSPYRNIPAHYLIQKDPRFPRKIWQTWKIDPLGFEEKDLNLARSWVGRNPDYRYEVLTDRNDLAYVERNFGPDGLNRLDIVYTYRELNARIIKADILRYLIMYVEGGVYTDIDVEALRPISRFVPERYEERDIDMVIGVEIDQPEFQNHTILGQKCMSFCQWTFMCKPRLPVMLKLVENIIAWLKTVADEQKCGIGDIKLDFDQVISGTGPSAFTRAVLDDISERVGRHVPWDPFHNLVESKLVGGVLVLPVEAFAAGQGHSDSGNHDTKYSLVKHHYHASHWPDNHPRYKHPIFGQVEDCNWNSECVAKWDNDKAEFEKLSPEEKTKQITLKEIKDREEREKEHKEGR